MLSEQPAPCRPYSLQNTILSLFFSSHVDGTKDSTYRDRPDAGLNPALAMMAVANDTAPARIVLQIAVRRDEGRDLHLNGLRQETLRSRAQDRRQGILRK